MSKIELQNEISHIKLKNWIFPRIGLPSSSYFSTVDRNEINQYGKIVELPSQQEIIAEIELAKLEAIEYAQTLGMSLKNPMDYACKFSKQRNTTANNVEDCIIPEKEIESQNEDVLQLFKEANLKSHSTKIDPTSITETSPYVKIQNKDGEILCDKKHTLCWFLGKSTIKLSSDRLLRVRAKPN